MSKKRNSKSFEIALSAISCALAVIFLLMGTLNHFLFLASGYILAQISLMIPLSKQFYAGDALAYIGTCILAVLQGAMGEAWPRRGNNARKQDHASPVFAKLLSKDRFFADSLSTLPTQ